MTAEVTTAYVARPYRAEVRYAAWAGVTNAQARRMLIRQVEDQTEAVNVAFDDLTNVKCTQVDGDWVLTAHGSLHVLVKAAAG